MADTTCTDEEFISLFCRLGATKAAQHLGISERKIYARRRRIEARLQYRIDPPTTIGTAPLNHSPRARLDVEDGVVLVASDCHYWPGPSSPGHRAFVQACKMFRPSLRAVVLNGDVYDGAAISRHPPINYSEQPSVKEEIEACQERLGEIEEAAGKVPKYWTLGNHDARFEARLAQVASEYKGVLPGLKDHFPLWEPCWSLWINNSVVIKHRWKGGIHAGWNNLTSGKHMVTGHTHQLAVNVLTNYAGTFFGVQTGTLADTFGPQFDYVEDNPRNWRVGFAVLTFKGGRLLWPELAHVISPDEVEFRGRIYEIPMEE